MGGLPLNEPRVGWTLSQMGSTGGLLAPALPGPAALSPGAPSSMSTCHQVLHYVMASSGHDITTPLHQDRAVLLEELACNNC